MIPTLHIFLLGDFLLVSGDTPVTTVDVPRLQSLLAYLVLHRTAPQARSHLAFLLWPDSTETQARAYLRKLVYQLRRALPNADAFLRVNNHNLQWLPEHSQTAWTLDILHVEQALVQATQAEQVQDTSAMQGALEQVVRLYRGDLLPSCYDEWILPERDRVRSLFFSAAQRLIALLEQEREYDAAIKVAQHLLHHDPLDEAVYRQVMRFYALLGNRTAALRVYHTCVSILERELTTEPSQATRQAYEALLQMDTASTKPRTFLSLPGVGAPLIGRKQEWGQLQTAWRKAASGYPHMVVFSGEAGIGKTKLAEELVAWVRRQGMTTASAQCYAVEGRLAYAPVIAWLRADAIQAAWSTLNPLWLTEVARLMPDLLINHPDLPHPMPMREGGQRQHFFNALAHALLDARQSLLLLLDDLQWCDKETLEWVHYLLRFESKARLLLIGTMRLEEILPEHPLGAFLGALQRHGLVTEVALGPLTPTETTTLAESVMNHPLDSSMSNRLYHETEGNPLFIVEMVRAGTLAQRAAEPDVMDTAHPLFTQSASTLPPILQTVLAARLAQLSPSAHALADLAAVIGRDFSSAVLAHGSRSSEESLVLGLDELWQRRIVGEQGMGTTETYSFSHDKLREQAYASLRPAHRRLLHHRVAQAFEFVYAQDLDAVCAQIAIHYEHAGLAEQAIPYYHRAGKVASRIYANEEAVTAFRQAITLLEASSQRNVLHVQQELQWQERVELYQDMGDVLERIGRFQEARQAYQGAIASVPQQEYTWLARLQRKNASSWQEGPANPEGTTHGNAFQGYTDAEHLLEQASSMSRTGWQYEWIQLQLARVFPRRSSVDETTIILEKAQPIVEQYGTVEQRGRFYLAVCLRDIERDRYVISEKTVLSCRNTLALVQQTGDRSLLGFAQFALGICLMWSGYRDEAEEQIHAAIRVGEQVGDATLLARCLTFLPFLFRQQGLVEKVRHVISDALTLPEARNIQILTGHQAWIAWRDGDRSLAEVYGRMLLEDRYHRQSVNSFYWTGLWPLIGVVLAQEKSAEAIDCVRVLLEPTQQPLPEALNTLLEAALQAWDTQQQEEARSLLHQALPLAEKMGYL